MQEKKSMAMVQSPKAAISSSSPSLILTSGASGRISALFSVQAIKSLLMLIKAFFFLLLVPFHGRRRTVVVAAGAARGSSSSSSSGDHQKSKDDKLLQDGGVHRTMVRVSAKIVPWKSGGSSMTAVVDSEVGARRAIAIKRVLQNDDPNSVREFSLFVSARGDTIFTQSWTPVSAQIRGLVVLMHGLNEHSGRYNDFAKQLNANGFKVYGMDWIGIGLSVHWCEKVTCEAPLNKTFEKYQRQPNPPVAVCILQHKAIIFKAHNCGHGGSDGLHGYVHSLDYAVADLKSFLDKVLPENPGLPCFCFGHSTGGAIVLKAAMDPKVEACVSGLVLTSPAVGIQPSHPVVALLAPVMSFFLPRFELSTSNNKGMPISRDPEALVAKYSDPLVYTGFVRIRTGYEILRITTYLQQNLKRLRVPFLFLHGAADTVTDPEASQKLYEEASSTDKSIKLLEGFLHDLLFEPERREIMRDIIDWLNCRV